MDNRHQGLMRRRKGVYALTPLVLSGMLCVCVLGADADKDGLAIILSDKSKDGVDVGRDLLLRPNVKDGLSYYVSVRNPTKVDKKVRVELRAGDHVIQSEPVTVGKGRVQAVTFGKSLPMGQPAAGWTLQGPPFQFVLALVDEQNKETERSVGVSVMEPRQYVKVSENSVYDPQQNQLRIELEALPEFSGPPCPVELELIPERIPGYVSKQKRVGTYSALLQKGGRAYLLAEKLQFEGRKRGNSLVYVTVDGYKRAFILKATFGGEGSAGQLKHVVSPLATLRLEAPPYSLPVANYKVCVEVDNSPRQDVVLEVGVDRANNGMFDTKPLSGDRDVRVTMNPAGPAGALVFKTDVHDWCTNLDLTNMLGERKVSARLVDKNSGPLVVFDENGDKKDRVIKSVIIADSPPESGRFIDPPARLARGTPLDLKAEGVDKYAGIQAVNFFVGKPGQDKIPPDAQIVKGRRNAEGIWSARVPVPADSKSVTVSAQFVNGIGLSVFDTITVDIYDPSKSTDSKDESTGGTIKGNVVRGELAQPGIEVTLTDGAGAAKGKTKTNAAGEFTFKNLAPGKYKVESSDPANRTKGEAAVTVEAGKTAEATISLFLFGR